MTGGNVNEFIDKLYYEDHYVLYNGSKYFFNGCQHKKSDGKTLSVFLEVYDLTSSKTVFTTEKLTADECIEAFENAPVWNGKTFYEVQDSMQWVDG